MGVACHVLQFTTDLTLTVTVVSHGATDLASFSCIVNASALAPGKQRDGEVIDDPFVEASQDLDVMETSQLLLEKAEADLLESCVGTRRRGSLDGLALTTPTAAESQLAQHVWQQVGRKQEELLTATDVGKFLTTQGKRCSTAKVTALWQKYDVEGKGGWDQADFVAILAQNELLLPDGVVAPVLEVGAAADADSVLIGCSVQPGTDAGRKNGQASAPE
eukprot:CAMPEP_0175859026 /NCGR_PEP_ID=MMETSP0107_2-20121207/30023_1 /TAXON_ID=195067 ORGANISM="Goniomonas pacifica, Strain CCMP1869" /NCGR_SAMPLE_ID=MMETSP0107_2 /ASSEMBLY_ACC=CAM_ASM_000203 /LENGTH=218 /DNA_ID=CAMNT_0017175593 /DNA_START=1 /DNA_END=658 /DNA_ORIENTATION=+